MGEWCMWMMCHVACSVDVFVQIVVKSLLPAMVM